jgi:hypothetical protein
VTTDSKMPLESGSVQTRQPVPNPAVTALLESKPAAEPQAGSPLQRWLHRTSVFLFVLIGAVAGVLLVILPWTPEWTDNYLLIQLPWLRSIISTGFFRGVCSGLGLLDIWIGFGEALHYHDRQ